LQEQLPDVHPTDILNILLACGRLRFLPLQLLFMLEQQPAQLDVLVAALKPKHADYIAYACAQLGYSSKFLPGMLLQQTAACIQDSNAGLLDVGSSSTLCWSAAVLDLQDCVPHVLQLVTQCKHDWASAMPGHKCQLYQVHLWLRNSHLPAANQGLLCVLSTHELQQCKNIWEEQFAEQVEASDSAAQRSLFAASQALPKEILQHAPVWQQRTADGALCINVAATSSSGVQLAIELVGQSNCVLPNSTFSGPTQFRRKLLAAQGYAVVSIWYWDWPRGSAAEQQQYLRARVQAALQSATPDSS
jgi:hypothetical protein